jgi:hypothetical protein
MNNLLHNKKDGEGNIDYSTKHNNLPHTDTDKRITKIWVQYLLCRDEDTGDTWTESFRHFPANDSFVKHLNKGKKKAKKKPKVVKTVPDNEDTEVEEL